MKKIFLCITSIFLLTGCSLFKSDMMDKIDVYTTTYPIRYLINYLYGDNSTIYSIYPNGVNFKDYELSDKKLNEYAKSSLYVFNSLDIDRNYAVKMVNINSNLKLIDASLGMEYDNAIEELWLNPYNYLMMAKNVKNGLLEYITNPYLISNKEHNGINDKYEVLNYDLSKLDAKYKEVLENTKYKTIVTDTDALKFLEKYGITVISLTEDIRKETINKGNSINDIVNKYGVNLSLLFTYNNITEKDIRDGLIIQVPIKTIDSTDINKVKKLILLGEIQNVYLTSNNTNTYVTKLIEDNNLNKLIINTMYTIDGGITNNNETYFTIMEENLELLKKELNK